MRKRENAARPSFQSPHSGVASPLDFCHFGRLNIDFERTAWPWKPMLRQRDDIVTGLERNAEPALAICRERSNHAFFVPNGENCIWKRRRIGNIGSGSNGSGTSRTNSNHSFDSRTAVRFDLAGGHASVGNKEREKEAQLCTSCHRNSFFEKHPIVYPIEARSLSDASVNIHIDADGLPRHHRERLRFGTDTLGRPPEHIENVIARR